MEDIRLYPNKFPHSFGYCLPKTVTSLLHNFEDLSLGVIGIDADLNIFFMNRVAGALLQVQPIKAINQNINAAFPSIWKAHVFQIGTTTANHLTYYKGRQLRINSIPLNFNEDCKHNLLIFEDQSEVNRLVGDFLNLKKKHDLLETIIEETFEELGAVDDNGKIIYISKKSALNYGVEVDQVLGTKIDELNKYCLLAKVSKTGVPEMTVAKRRGKKPIPVMVTPFFKNNVLKGAICRNVFKGIDEVKEYLNKITGSMEGKKKFEDKSMNTRQFHSGESFENIIGNCREMLDVKQKAVNAAKNDSSILILGETGTGKELFARAIHDESSRSTGPFISVNCASIPENLLEAELFGYEDGSFTGARKGGKLGKFEIANHGTLFLDEIGDMSISMQAKILRVLEDHEVHRIGSAKPQKVNIRVIAATNKNLSELVTKGLFREDLYYRLDVMTIHLPPLRERLEDIAVIVSSLIPRIQGNIRKKITGISQEACDLLKLYHWPGNVRELKNVLEGAMNICNENIINTYDLPKKISDFKKNNGTKVNPGSEKEIVNLKDLERIALIRTLELYNNNIRQTAKALGITRTSLYNKIRRYKIELSTQVRPGTYKI